jgi:hypothetical protein
LSFLGPASLTALVLASVFSFYGKARADSGYSCQTIDYFLAGLASEENLSRSANDSWREGMRDTPNSKWLPLMTKTGQRVFLIEIPTRQSQFYRDRGTRQLRVKAYGTNVFVTVEASAVGLWPGDVITNCERDKNKFCIHFGWSFDSKYGTMDFLFHFHTDEDFVESVMNIGLRGEQVCGNEEANRFEMESAADVARFRNWLNGNK